MKTVTNEFKEQITKLGREIDFKIFLYANNKIITENSNFLITEDNKNLVVQQFNEQEIAETITSEDIYNISIVNQGKILSTMMKEVDFEVKQNLKIGDVVSCQFGLKVGEEYEYIDYGKYMIYSKEFNEDTKSYSYVAFDRMLLTMQEASKDFLTSLEGKTLAFTIHKICEETGLNYTATQEELTEYPNLNKTINEGTFTDMQITYRDILDMICQALGLSMIVEEKQLILKKFDKQSKEQATTTGTNELIINDVIQGNATNYTVNGKCEQNGTPTPSTPIEIKTIPTYKNLFNINQSGGSSTRATASVSNNILTVETTSTSAATSFTTVPISNSSDLLGKTITITANMETQGATTRIDIWRLNSSGRVVGSSLGNLTTDGGTLTITLPDSFTTNSTQFGLIFFSRSSSIGEVGSTSTYSNIMLVEGSTVEDYVPYGAYARIKIENETQEQNKVISLNKENNFDINKQPSSLAHTTVTVENNELTVTITTESKYTSYATIPIPNSDELLGKTVTLSANMSTDEGSTRMRLYTINANGSPVGSLGTLDESGSITITLPNTYPTNVVGFGLVFYPARSAASVGTSSTYSNITLFEGNDSTPYYELCGIGEDKDILSIDNNICTLTKNIGKISNYNGETITTNYISTTGELTTGATIYYVLSTPEAINLTNTTIPLYEGTNHITLKDDLETTTSITYNKISSDIEEIDEQFIKDTNVSFGEKYMINSVVLSRSEDTDNIYRRDEESIAKYGVHEFKIKDNLIMLYNDREDYIDEIFEQLNGLEYYINDYSSTGITYLDWLDFYNVQIGDKTYKCLMLNDEININQGLEENIYTEEPEETVTDYKTSSKTDKEVSFIVDKQNGSIKAKVSKGDVINEINLDESGAEINANKISLAGKTIEMTSDNITINSTNFQVDKDGNMTANSGTFGGTLNTGQDCIIGDNLYVGQSQSSSGAYERYIKMTENTYIRRWRNQGSLSPYPYEMLSLQSNGIQLITTSSTQTSSTTPFYSIGHLTRIQSTGQNISMDLSSITMSSQPVISSDERLKQEIKDVSTSWIDELKVKEFEYIKSPDKKQIGLIAQDYEDKEYAKYFLNQNEDGYYGIAYGNITNALIQYCQEMKKEINSLKKEIKQLKESDK